MVLIAAVVCSSAAWGQFTARATINVTGSGLVPTETDYVPNVCLCENGLASFEALKAQTVAARTFAYYTMNLQGFINDGTIDQVYSCAGSPLAIHHAAALATEGEILWVRDNIAPEADVLIASFYAAGAIPSGPFNVSSPGIIVEAGDPDPTGTEHHITYPYANNLSGGNNLGSTQGFIGTPSNPNWPNRGSKSQNGADYLSDNSLHYIDILKYYYGADIQLRTATTAGTDVQFSRKTLTDFDNYGDRFGNTFEGHEGYFHRAPNFSGSTTANVAASTADRSSVEKHGGTHSQLIDIVYDETLGGEFLLRHLAGARYSDFGGLSQAAERVSNLQFESIGSVGFWLKTDDPGVSVSVALDDSLTGDRGVFKSVIADNQWHRYQWFLDRDDDWEAWVGGGNGVIDGLNVSLDSIQFRGSADAQIYLDDVFWDPQAVFLPRFAGDYNGNGIVDAADYTVWRDLLGQMGPGLAADGDDDGKVDVVDYLIWSAGFGDVVSPAGFAALAAVPEPSVATLSGLAAVGVLGFFSRRKPASTRMHLQESGFNPTKTIYAKAVVIPEPGTVVLLLVAGLGWLAMRRLG